MGLLLSVAGGGAPASAGAECPAVAGVERVLDRAEARYVIVGERHGRAEIPAFFGHLVCLAALRGPVIDGLEAEAHQQAALDVYLRSDGGAAAGADLLKQAHWRNPDGRASAAMFALVERLRALRAAGYDVTILAVMRPGGSPEARERGMAEAWIEAAQARPAARLIALVGKVHAETEWIGFIPPAASYLPAQERLTLSDVPSGSRTARILSRAPPGQGWPRYDLYYAVGRPFTPSALAREEALANEDAR